MGDSEVKVESNAGLEAHRAKMNRRYLAPKEIAAYCLTSYGQNALNTFVGSSKQFFMMNFLGITGGQFGTMGLISTVWDALDDPLSGIIIDRSRTRWGRLRPFLIAPIPFWAITAILFFIVPFSLTQTQRMVYATVLTIVNGIGNSYFGGWALLLYNITPNTNERSNLIATEKMVNLFNYLPSLVPLFVDFLPKATNYAVTQPNVYLGASVLFVAFAIGCALFGFRHMFERVTGATKDELAETSILDSVKIAVKNPPLFVLLLSNFFAQVKGVGGASEDFFWFNCTGKLSNRFVSSLFTGLPNYVMTPLTPAFIRKFGVRPTAVFSGIFGGVAYTLLYFIGYHPTENSVLNFVIIVAGLTVCGLPNHVMGVCNPVLTGDMYDYLEWKSDMRSEGLVNAVNGYISKLSQAVISYISGAVFDWIKFVPQVDSRGNAIPHPSATVRQGIWGIFCLAPAVARFGYGISLLLFKVSGEFKVKMNDELAERRHRKILNAATADNSDSNPS